MLVSVIGDAFRASKKEHNVRGERDLVVEALRHKVRPLCHVANCNLLKTFPVFHGQYYGSNHLLQTSIFYMIMIIVYVFVSFIEQSAAEGKR